MSGMDIVVRTIAEDEFDAWARAEHLGFNQRASDEYVETARSFAELDRTFAAFDGGDIVGSATTRTSAIATPGGKSKLGYVDDVSVLPTHRRRGIMTRVMRQQLDQMRERGEPLAALSASESLIYERFGYGIATWLHRWKIDRRHTTMKFPPDGGGHPRFVSAETAREEWPRLHRPRPRESRRHGSLRRLLLGQRPERRRRSATGRERVLPRRLPARRAHSRTMLIPHTRGDRHGHLPTRRGRRGRGRTLAILLRH